MPISLPVFYFMYSTSQRQVTFQPSVGIRDIKVKLVSRGTACVCVPTVYLLRRWINSNLTSPDSCWRDPEEGSGAPPNVKARKKNHKY